MEITRRKLFGVITAFIAAPAIIRVADMMPIKAFASRKVRTIKLTINGEVLTCEWPEGHPGPLMMGIPYSHTGLVKIETFGWEGGGGGIQ